MWFQIYHFKELEEVIISGNHSVGEYTYLYSHCSPLRCFIYDVLLNYSGSIETMSIILSIYSICFPLSRQSLCNCKLLYYSTTPKYKAIGRPILLNTEDIN